ncbi:MAG: WXG100 family type VII secretion target [Mycobacteriaceae bacterium]
MGRSVMHADVEQMIATSEKLLTIADAIERHYTSTKSDVDELFSSHWHGIASHAREELWKDWDEGFQVIARAYREMSQRIRTAAAEFTHTEENNTEHFHHIGQEEEPYTYQILKF